MPYLNFCLQSKTMMEQCNNTWQSCISGILEGEWIYMSDCVYAQNLAFN